MSMELSSRDPIGYEVSEGSLFAYVGNRALIATDWEGLKPGKGERNWGNHRPSDCDGKALSEVEKMAEEEFKKNGASKHWKALRAWIKIMKKNGLRCFGPIFIVLADPSTCSGAEPEPRCVCECTAIDYTYVSGWFANNLVSITQRSYSLGFSNQTSCSRHSTFPGRYYFKDVIVNGKKGYVASQISCGCATSEFDDVAGSPTKELYDK